MANKLIKMLHTIAFIIIIVLASIILLSYFKINMNPDDKVIPNKFPENKLVLNRFAVYEGIENLDKVYRQQIIA
uniref:Uncharacterized protein n=1 Tax=viral metagenome TaxID=1070528 RepID=A0A6C0DY77_9ZZZZ